MLRKHTPRWAYATSDAPCFRTVPGMASPPIARRAGLQRSCQSLPLQDGSCLRRRTAPHRQLATFRVRTALSASPAQSSAAAWAQTLEGARTPAAPTAPRGGEARHECGVLPSRACSISPRVKSEIGS